MTENKEMTAEELAAMEAEEQARLEAEEQARLEAEEQARLEAEEQERLEEEEQRAQQLREYLSSFSSDTVFFDRIITDGDVQRLGGWTKDAQAAYVNGWIDNHMDESELTFVPNNKELTSGVYYLKGHEKPESTIEEMKVKKLAEISAEAHKYSQYECGEMYLTSSVGFKINADHKSQDNIRGLIALNTATAFKDFDNQFHKVSVDDLNTMLTECYVNGSSLYQQKFEYESRVDAAKSAEDLYFDVIFSMADFSTK